MSNWIIKQYTILPMMESCRHQIVTVALTVLYNTCFDTCTVIVIQVKTYNSTNTILIGTYTVLYYDFPLYC